MAVDVDNRAFTVALTADFLLPDGGLRYPSFNLQPLTDCPGIRVEYFREHRAEIGAAQVEEVQAVIVLTPHVTVQTLSRTDNLLAIGRFGVGYDGVDVSACTSADVAVFITAGAVDRSVAEATLTWMLALTHHVAAKDRLVREGRWDDRSQWMGCELRGRTLGIIGLGGIGRELVALTRSFGMSQPVAFDPLLTAPAAAALGVKLVPFDELMATADIVSIHCPLNEHTRGLIGARELALMKSRSYLINTARGGIIDEDALFAALTAKSIAGAAIDCFADEPITSPHRFGKLDNVLLAPHCISWTDELFRSIGDAACQGMLDIARGEPPRGILNPQVLSRPSFQQKWAALATAQLTKTPRKFMPEFSLTEAELALYRTEGFVVVEALFTADDLARVDATIRGLVDRAVAGEDMSHVLELEPEPIDGQRVPRRIYNPYDQHETFRNLANDPRLLDRIESLIGPDINLQHSKLNMKPARVGSVVDWHQDLAYFPHTNDDLVTTLVYLDDATEENGCLQVLPRHHHHYFNHAGSDGKFSGMITEDLSNDRFGRPVALSAPAGSAIFMHCITPHSSLPNRSSKARRTLIYEYRANDAFPIWYGPMTAKAEVNYRPIRGKPAHFARFGGPLPLVPIVDEYASLYELQARAKTKPEVSQ